MSRDQQVRHLFVYGTLRPGGGAPDRVRRTLEEGAEHLGTARARGRLLVAGSGSYPALVRDDAAGPVTGDLYRLRSPGRVLEVLDRYEGRRPDGTGLYRRERIPVRLLDRVAGDSRGGGVGTGGERRLRAWAYLYNRDTQGLRQIEGGDWLRR